MNSHKIKTKANEDISTFISVLSVQNEQELIKSWYHTNGHSISHVEQVSTFRLGNSYVN
jgi:hypothetical protein